jgi:hypothetical protein
VLDIFLLVFSALDTPHTFSRSWPRHAARMTQDQCLARPRDDHNAEPNARTTMRTSSQLPAPLRALTTRSSYTCDSFKLSPCTCPTMTHKAVALEGQAHTGQACASQRTQVSSKGISVLCMRSQQLRRHQPRVAKPYPAENPVSFKTRRRLCERPGTARPSRVGYGPHAAVRAQAKHVQEADHLRWGQGVLAYVLT